MGATVFDVDHTADERRQHRIIGLFPWNEQPLVGQVADARSEFELKQMHETEHMIGEASRIGVMFLDAKIGLMIQKAVEPVGRVAHADIDYLCMERRVLIGTVRVEQDAGFTAIFRIGVAGGFGASSRLEPLPV